MKSKQEENSNKVDYTMQMVEAWRELQEAVAFRDIKRATNCLFWIRNLQKRVTIK